MSSIGFWGPTTSSIDFCEDNYVYTWYCAEIWNSITSLFIVYTGFIAFYHSVECIPGVFYQRYVKTYIENERLQHRQQRKEEERRQQEREEDVGKRKKDDDCPKGVNNNNGCSEDDERNPENDDLLPFWKLPTSPNEFFQIDLYPRYILCWSFFFLVGGGSAMFHATLQRGWQATDEVPMVIGNCIFIYCGGATRKSLLALQDWKQWVKLYYLVNTEQKKALEADSTITERYDRSLLLESQLEPRYKNIALIFLILGIFKVSLYVIFENYICFFLSYGAGVLVMVTHSYYMLVKVPFGREENRPIYKHLLFRGYGSYGLGLTLWIFENLTCRSSILWIAEGIKLLHLHIFWHFLAAYGTMYYVLVLMTNHMDSLGIKVTLRYKTKIMLPVIRFEF